MKIAITGASGFIGRHVLAELENQHVEVVAVTRDASNLIKFGFTGQIVEFDLTEVNANSFSLFGKPDVLIHLAWEGLPNYKALYHFETELPRQFRFLKSMIDGGLSSLLVTGTCFEYGMLSGPLSEKLVTQPCNPYGYAKDSLRRQLEFLSSYKKFNLTWGRLFYMYGQDQHESSLYSQINNAVQSGRNTFNMSGGEQLRDFLPVREVARIISLLAMCGEGKGCVNVCSGKPLSIRKLVEEWIAKNGWEIDLNLGYYPYPDYEPMAFWGNRNRLDLILQRLEAKHHPDNSGGANQAPKSPTQDCTK
ncbi:MAG: NAD-dependent epimerase/dehydratase family protein [Desulfobulbaceae bacterium]|nr:NAD-dependent epimerase/dehydratase family protein [Desulfobulbaceae bacterium]